MKRKVLQFFVLLLAMVIMLGVLHFFRFGGLTGFAIFEQGGQGDFDLGTYANTEYNGSAVVLSGSNLSGNYTSQIFNATGAATWNNLSYLGGLPTVEFIYAVDAGGDVYFSSDLALNWSAGAVNYGRTSDTEEMFADSDYLYILANSNREVWRSGDFGSTWSVVNDSFANNGLLLGEVDSSGVLYVADASGDVYSSSDDGVTWSLKGDFNGGATNNGKGMDLNASDAIYVVDGSGSVFVSTNAGVDWTEQNSGYGGGAGTDDLEVDSAGDLYILNNKDVHKSSDDGVTWSLINDSFTPLSNDGLRMLIDSNDNFFIADASGRVFKSTNLGIAWVEQGDLNGGAGSNPKGLAEFGRLTNLTFHGRNCSSSDCSDGIFANIDADNINLQSQFFQYRALFTSPATGSPYITNVTLDYTLSNTAPVVSIVVPGNDDGYGTNESLSLNFTVSDSDDNLGACWYNMDSGTNVTIFNCANTTFDTSDGSHTLYIFVNDTLGEGATASVNFSVSVGAPSISLSSPTDSYLSSQGVEFVYTATDLDLDSCQLWGDFTGTFILNQTDSGVVSGAESTFNLNLVDGTYIWNVQCNDTIGNSAFNGNKTFYIDTTNPGVVITEPIGTKTSRTVTAEFDVSDSFVISYCYYNVTDVNDEVLISDIEVANCAANVSLVFVLGSDQTNANFNLWSNDSAGNSNSSTSVFSVDTSTSPPPPVGGGGGGGRAIVPPQNSEVSMTLSGLEQTVLKKGTGESFELGVTNDGLGFLNSCHLEFDRSAGAWLKSEDNAGLSPGEKFTFGFSLIVPEDTEPGEYRYEVKIVCDEGEDSVINVITVYRNAFEAEVLEYERDGNTLKITYSLKEFAGVDHEIKIIYELVDFDNIPRFRGEEIVILGGKDSIDNILSFELPKDSFGEFNLRMTLNDGVSEVVAEGPIFLPSRDGGFTGLILSDDNRRTLSVAGGVVVAIIVLLIVARLLYKRHKRSRRAKRHKRKGRTFIELDL